MSFFHVLPTASLALVLGACANAPAPLPHISLQWQLRAPLTIPAGEASLRLQYGHPVARNGVQDSEPHCILEVDKVGESAQIIAPATFQVVDVRYREETFSGLPVLAWNPLGMGIGRDGGPSHVFYVTEFLLHSPGQPGVRSLTCQHNQATAGVTFPRHLTAAEIRKTLGDLAFLESVR